jgi:hypothetical protein
MRVHKLLRWCVSLWWRRFESSEVACHFIRVEGESPFIMDLRGLRV